MSEFILGDCMGYLKDYPDNYFDLAIVDPPYGVKRLENPKGRLEKYGDTRKANNGVPTTEYFTELFRVSRNQVIWGAITLNYRLADAFLRGISTNQ